MKANPNIKVQYDFSMNQQTLQVALKANELPDAFWCQGNKTPVLSEMVSNDFLAPVDEYIDTSIFSPEQLTYGTVDGKLYCSPPAFIDTITVYYNKDIFAANGYDVPKTFDDFLGILEGLKSKGIQPMALAGADEWGRVWPFWTLSSLFASDAIRASAAGTGTMNDPSVVKAFSYYREWFEKGYFGKDAVAISSNDAMLTFTNQKAAMLIGGSWSNNTVNAAGINTGRFSLPDENGKKTAFVAFGNLDTYVMSASAANKDAVGKYIAYLSSLEAKQIFENSTNLPSMMQGH